MGIGGRAGEYVVPSYRAPDDTPWYHFLHGNVPGHEIDFMYRPEVPQGQLSRQHFSHLSRLMKYIEPQTNGLYAFAIGNLSRDDTQYEPGHGGVALIFGLRIRGVTDHAGRQDPPFAHAIAAVDRSLDYMTLLATASLFHRRVLGAAEAAEWYRTYVRCATDSPADVEHVLAGYVANFSDLPQTTASTMSTKWVTGGAPQPKRVVIVHEDGAPFEVIARCAARIAAMLYRSDIRWTSISNGREADVPNGVSIRLISERDFSLNPSGDATEKVRRIREVPEDEAGIAQQLFGAKVVANESQPVMGWRERYASIAPDTFDPKASPSAAPKVEEPPRSRRDPFRPPSNRPPTSPGGESARAAKADTKSLEEDPTHIWDGRPTDILVGSAGKDSPSDDEIQVDLEGLDQPAPPATLPLPPKGVSVRSAPSQPKGAPIVTKGSSMTQPMFAPPGVTGGVNAQRPVTARNPSPAEVKPSPIEAKPPAARDPKLRPVEAKVPPDTRKSSPSVPEVVPSSKAPTKAAKAKEWEPSPNFRKPQKSGGRSVLRWTLLLMVLAGIILAVLYFVYTGAPLPDMRAVRALWKTYVDPGSGSPKEEPAKPEPSAEPGKTEPSAATAVTPSPAPPVTPSPPPSTSAAPPADSASATPSAKASASASASAKAGSSKPVRKPSSVFDAPLELGKDQ